MTLLLLALNVLVFVYQMTLGTEALQDFVTTYGVIPREIENGEDLYTLITSMFVHGGFAHILGNMLFLWVFGDNIEHRFGSTIFVLFYLVSGLAATFAHIATNSGSPIPSVGASGALSGVLGAYILLYPTNRVRVLIGYFVTSVPAVVFLGVWFITQFINGVAALNVETAQTSGVAYWAHIGGFVAGVVLGLILRGMTTEEDRQRRAARY
jgi:membrane associated rhomboid family serine protease